ncbi:MAG: hypothetical protein M0Z30_05965 [Actinomycetota bacterium]|nr:hypothetical protein [Actinomycetota bacterium]
MTCSPLDPTACVTDIAKSVATNTFTSIANDFAKAADSATNWLWNQLDASTAVHLGGAGFDLDIGIVIAITGTVAVGLFVLQVISAVLKRDPSALGRALKGLVVAFIGGGLAVAITNIALAAVDALCSGVVQVATGQSLAGMGHSILPAGAVAAATTNPALTMLLSLAALAAVLIVWAALMVRKILIVVSAVFAPLAFAGSLADITAAWTRRWIETVVALVVSKLILVIIFVVGLGMIVNGVGQAGTGRTQVATQTLSGILVLALAGFAPWVALKLVHFSGDQFHHLHSLAASSTAGAQKVAQVPRKAQAVAMTAMGGPAGAAAGSASAGRAAAGRSAGGMGAATSPVLGAPRGGAAPLPAMAGSVGPSGTGGPRLPASVGAVGDVSGVSSHSRLSTTPTPGMLPSPREPQV